MDRLYNGVFICHGDIKRFSKTSCFCCLTDTNCLRKGLVWLATWSWFENFITLAIILNSVMLASTDYTTRLEPTYESEWTPI